MKLYTLSSGEDKSLSDIFKMKTVAEETNIPASMGSIKKEPGAHEEGDSLEELLGEFKISGRYHLKCFILYCFLVIVNAPHSVNYMFTAEKVDYRCRYTNCKDIELVKLEQNSSIDVKCHMYDVIYQNVSCTKDNFNTSSVTDCTEWVYDKPNSFVADFNLGCQDWKRTLVGTMHSMGFMLGLIFIGPMSDKIGRKKLVIFNAVSSGIVGLAKSMATSYWAFIALEMLEPLLGESYAVTFTMSIEAVTRKHRPTVILLLSISNTIGQILMALVAYSTASWRMFLVYIYAPALLFVVYILWMDESLRWLLTKGKKTEAEAIIRRAAVMNKITIDESRIANISVDTTTSNCSLSDALKITFSSRKLFARFFVSICVWFTSLFNSYSLLINSVSLEGNKYINFGLVSLSGTLTGVLLFYVLAKFKRKAPLILALTLTGVLCMTQPFVPKELSWLSTLLYVCGKMTSLAGLRIAYLYTTELFPTYTRNTMLALCSALGRTAAILAPQTPLLMVYWSGLPLLLLGILSLLTASVVTLMPDTSEDVLPDNVKQAEDVGKGKKNITS